MSEKQVPDFQNNVEKNLLNDPMNRAPSITVNSLSNISISSIFASRKLFTTEEKFVQTLEKSPFPPPNHSQHTFHRSQHQPFHSHRNQMEQNSSQSTNFQQNEAMEETHSSSKEEQQESESKTKSFAERMMEKQGWKGKGLGRDEQGEIEPIQTSEKIGTGGLGYEDKSLSGFEIGKVHSVDINEFVPHHQDFEFISNSEKYTPLQWDLSWMKEGKRDYDQYDWNLYCDEELVKVLFSSKSKLDSVPMKNFLDARTRSNPYEIIGKHFFMNRAALKMANLDSMFHLVPNSKGVFRFADFCAGPGGFTQYIFWRRFTYAAFNQTFGYGFTLKGNEDWDWKNLNKLQRIGRNFKVNYGEDNTGNILLNNNIKYFTKQVMDETQGKGLNLVTGDGGISVEGEENFQETKLKQLVMCQFLTMFNILGKGGNFVCKFFDLFTPFTVGLIYILYKHFEKICIIKPYTSRPANSERYIVCFNLQEQRPPITEYLFKINEKLHELSPTERDIIEIIEIKDENFINYVRKSSTEILKNQIQNFELLFKYIEDKQLMPLDQKNIKQRCLKEWNIPENFTPSRRDFHSGGTKRKYNSSQSYNQSNKAPRVSTHDNSINRNSNSNNE